MAGSGDLMVHHGVSLRLPGSGNDNFDAVSGDSSRFASGSGRYKERYSDCPFRYAFVVGCLGMVSYVTLGVKRKGDQERGA